MAGHDDLLTQVDIHEVFWLDSLDARRRWADRYLMWAGIWLTVGATLLAISAVVITAGSWTAWFGVLGSALPFVLSWEMWRWQQHNVKDGWRIWMSAPPSARDLYIMEGGERPDRW